MRPQGQTVGYVRVSSADQNLARQLDTIGQVDRVFEDKVSGGSRTQRQGLADCLRYIRDGDVVRVASMDRLARSLVDLQQIVDEILAKGAQVHFIKENQTYTSQVTDPIGRLLMHVLGGFAEFERNLIRERQAEGIRIAKAAGKYRGRARRLTPQQITEARRRLSEGVSKTRIAADLKVDRSTLYRALAATPDEGESQGTAPVAS